MAFLPRACSVLRSPFDRKADLRDAALRASVSMTGPRTQVTAPRPAARIGLRVRLVGQLHRPALGVLAGVDLEEAGAIEATDETILPALDLELAVRGAHEGFALPLAAPLVHCVEIVILSGERAAQQRRAIERLEVPPAFADPALAIGVGERDTDPAAGVVAHPQIRARGLSRNKRCSECGKRQQIGCDSVHGPCGRSPRRAPYSMPTPRCQPAPQALRSNRQSGRAARIITTSPSD